MAAKSYVALATCCLLLQAVLGDPCGGYDTANYVCIQGLKGAPGYQLCPKSASYACYTPDALKVGGAPYGCGGPRTCSDQTAASQGSPSKSGSVTGDPYLEGFDGRTFDFMGAKNQVFNMITHPDHQLNAAFIDADFPDYVNGTFIGAVGILHHSHQVQAHVLSNGKLEVIADSVALTPDHVTALGDAFVELDAFGTSLTFRSDLCIWKILAIAPYTWEDKFYKAHIDMQLELLKDPVAMHGVLGQTVNGAKGIWADDDLEFHGDGLAADYQLDHLLASDFKFNMFGNHGATPLVLTRARMLLANAVSKSAATYPSFASVSTYPHSSSM